MRHKPNSFTQINLSLDKRQSVLLITLSEELYEHKNDKLGWISETIDSLLIERSAHNFSLQLDSMNNPA